MKQRITLFVFAFFAIISALAAQNLTVSGIMDSSLSLRAGAGDASPISFGFEEYANIRFQSKIRDRAAVYGAVNLFAAAGDYAALLASGNPAAYVGNENYIAAIELERLYLRINGDPGTFGSLDFDCGLMRLPFGFGQIWGPSDFLNPKNPLKPDARPRAVLGAGLFLYPASLEDLKLLFFGAAPRDPFAGNGKGSLFGLSLDQHWERMSLQALYSFQTPKAGSNNGIHRIGLSVKADVEVGLLMDALYSYNSEAGTEIDGLSFSIGADYSFFDGNLIVLAEYLYNGSSSSTALGYGGSFSCENYLYTGFTWRFNDFTNMTAALISGFDDVSFTPVISLNHDLFQGAALIVTAQIPLDRDLFANNGSRGELGPLPPGSPIGSYFNLSAKLRLRF